MSRKRYTFTTAIAGVFAGAVLLSACSGVTPGNPQSTDGSSSNASSGSSGLPTDGAPKVQHPLDTAKLQADMCSTLNKSAQTALHINQPGQPKDGPTGPACGWHVANSSTSAPGDLLNVTVEVVSSNPHGLSTIYQNRSSMAVFQPLGEIGGYPAIIYGDVDGRPQGVCAIAVGVSDELDFSIGSGSAPGTSDPCQNTKKVVEQFIQTVKADAK